MFPNDENNDSNQSVDKSINPEHNLPSEPVSPMTIEPPNQSVGLVSEPQANGPELNTQGTVNQINSNVNSSGMIVGGGGLVPSASKKSKKSLMVASLVAGLFILGGLGYVFGFYIPNKPENVWRTGLNRTGKALDKIVTQSTTKEQLEVVKKTQLTASVEGKAFGAEINSNLDMKFDDLKSNGGFKFELKSDGQETKTAIDFISSMTEGENYPDIYLKGTGLTESLLALIVPNIGDYENKWIYISKDYLKGLQSTAEASTAKKQQSVNSGDVSEAVKVSVQTVNDYVMTDSKDKAVLTQKSFIKQEKLDNNVTANHYTATINKPNAKKFCSAFINNISETNLFKKLNEQTEEDTKKSIQSSIQDCEKSVDGIKDGKEYHIWIDKKYKLLHKVRDYSDSNKDEYIEFGQIYKGGDDLNLFMNFHSPNEPMDLNLSAQTNTKTMLTTMSGKVTGGKDDQKTDLKMKLETKPLSSQIDIKKPDSVLKIEDLVKQFSAGSSGSLFGTQTNPQDSERTTDINGIYAQLEVFFAGNGYYPSLANMNNSSFIKTNFAGLDKESLKDPAGTSSLLVSGTATKTQYGYKPTECTNNGTECSKYQLSAMLSTGQLFTKDSLN